MAELRAAPRADKREIMPEFALRSHMPTGKTMEHPLFGDVQTPAVRAKVHIIEMSCHTFRAEPYTVIDLGMFGVAVLLGISYPLRSPLHIIGVKYWMIAGETFSAPPILLFRSWFVFENNRGLRIPVYPLRTGNTKRF